MKMESFFSLPYFIVKARSKLSIEEEENCLVSYLTKSINVYVLIDFVMTLNVVKRQHEAAT